jgi:hypothetical protein
MVASKRPVTVLRMAGVGRRLEFTAARSEE